MPPQDILHKILEAGGKAPSGDNCQPWRFTLEEGGILLFNVPTADTSLYNFRQKASLISHGALIENIKIAATSFGYEARTALFPDSSNRNCIARITFEKYAGNSDPLHAAILARATNRKLYAPHVLTEGERSGILHAAQVNNTSTVLAEGPAVLELASLASLNEQIVFENPRLHGFLFNHIRWTDEEEKRARNGMFVKTLELQGPDKIAFRIFRRWPLLKILNYVGVSRIVSATNAKNYASAAAIGSITIPSDSDENFIAAGRAFERVWLAVTNAGLSLQPLTGVALLHERLRAGGDGISGRHAALIRTAYSKIGSIFGIKDGILVLMFRIGKGGAPSAYSSRYSIESLITHRTS